MGGFRVSRIPYQLKRSINKFLLCVCAYLRRNWLGMRKIWSIYLSVLLVHFLAVPVSRAGAEEIDWVMIEARLVPQNCSKPLECVPKSSLILRNLAFMEQDETRELALFLNRIATVRGIDAKDNLNYSSPMMIQTLHQKPKADKPLLLKGHPGVYFDSTTLDSISESKAFSEFVRVQLSAAGVRFLSKEEVEHIPGRPKLSIRFNRHRESEGCIIPFSVSMSISEETVLVRNPALKTTSTIWSGSVRENLANRNYRPESAIRELVEKFLADWNAAQA